MSWRDDLRAIIEHVSQDELPDLLGELARLEALAHVRLRQNGTAPSEPKPNIEPQEKLIDTKAACEILNVPLRWLYDRADRLPFTRRLGPQTLRWSEPGLRRWLKTRR